MADTITFSELGLSGVGPVKQVAPKAFLVGSLPQSDIQDLEGRQQDKEESIDILNLEIDK
jgi:hypothetical protein